VAVVTALADLFAAQNEHQSVTRREMEDELQAVFQHPPASGMFTAVTVGTEVKTDTDRRARRHYHKVMGRKL
jgi:hypothetical protein